MVCEDDDELRDELEALLRAHDEGAGDQLAGAVAAFATAQAEAPPLAVPDKLAGYQLGEQLGAGGMGVVYRAVHPVHGAVALKLLPNVTVADPQAEARFRSEAAVLAALEHPALCRLFESFVEDGYAGMAMELVDGFELATILKERALPCDAAFDVIYTLADALALAHEQQVIHRDLKPSNVLLQRDGSVKLIDFGIAKFADQKLTATGQILGTPSYMAPEQWRGAAMDARTDLWALGVLWHEMLTGLAPFKGDDLLETAERVVNGEPPPLPEQSEDAAALATAGSLIRWLLQKDPAARPTDCRALLAAMDTQASEDV